MLTHFDDFCVSGFVHYDPESTTVHLVCAMTEVGGPSDGFGKIRNTLYHNAWM